MADSKMTVNILGTEYAVSFKPDKEVCEEMNCDLGYCGGYCDAWKHEIVIANLDSYTDDEQTKGGWKKTNLRHEIVHAFLNESGLQKNALGVDCWPKNEEMVDWFAIQGPKIYAAWQSVRAV